MKKNRRNGIHRVLPKRKKERTPKKQERDITILVEIPESQNNKKENIQKLIELLELIGLKKKLSTNAVKQNGSSEIEILYPIGP